MSTISINSISLYTIYDVAAESYGPPFCAKTDAVATRMFSTLMKNEQASSLEYALYRIGSYDDSTATIGSIKPVKIDAMAALVKKIEGTFGETK